MFEVCVKSGTGNYSSLDGNDKAVATIDSIEIPRVGETLVLYNNSKKSYLVKEVERTYCDINRDMDYYVTVYVAPIN